MSEAHFRTYIGTLTAFAAALAISWIHWYEPTFDPRFMIGAAIFAAFLLFSDAFSVRINERITIDASDIGLILAVAALGPVWAALAALPADLRVGRRDWLRTAYEVSHSVAIIFLAGTVFSLASEPLLISGLAFSVDLLYGILLAGMTLIVANWLIAGLLMKVKYGQAFYEIWAEDVQPYLVSNAVSVLTAGLGALAWVASGPVATVIVVAGSIGSQVLVYRSREHMNENIELRAQVDSLEEALTASNTAFGTMIVRDLGRRDGYTHRHAAATAVYAADLGREMKLDETCVRRLRMAGLLHNIGMFGLPEDLLLATGKLNSIARHQLDEHPARGEEALAAVSEFEEVASWVRWHHERPDGRGYPDKLRGSWIPPEAKILAVAQAYAAMVLDQPQRPGMPPAEAREKLAAGLDTEFDGVVVRAFLRILDTESEGYLMADDHRFIFPGPDGSHHATAWPGFGVEEGRNRRGSLR
ncbi:MAG: HD domain-containing protein [Actinomycetota bacterium]|nr:HD domain-containing protein [Actinomycetota bacterium]